MLNVPCGRDFASCMAAILQYREQFKGRGGESGLDSTDDKRVFLVEYDDPTAGTYEVGTAFVNLGFTVGSVHPHNILATVRKVTIKNTKSPRWWKFTVSYSTKAESRKEEDPDDDPILISIEEEDFERPAGKNRDGEAILTSSGTVPDPPIMVEDTRRIYVIKGSVAGTVFPAWENAGFRKSINSDTFTLLGTGRVVPAKFAKVKSIRLGDVDYRAGTIPFRPFTIRIEVLDLDDGDWDEQTSFLDASFYRRPVALEISAGTYTASDRVEITLPNGKQPRNQQLLDGSGLPLSDPDPSNAVFRESRTLRLKAFAGNLPGCV